MREKFSDKTARSATAKAATKSKYHPWLGIGIMVWGVHTLKKYVDE